MNLPVFSSKYANTNTNVKLTLTFTFFAYLARGIFNQNVLSAYIYLLPGGNNSKIGFLTGLQGLCQVLIAPCCGYIADKYKRDRVLRTAGALGILTALVMAFALWIGSYPALCAASGLWGLFWALSNPSLEALFADSIAEGRRSKVFALKFALLKIANAAGPVISIFMFLFLGNTWEPQYCLAVIFVGLGISLLPSSLLFFLDDRKSLQEEDGLKEPLLTKGPEDVTSTGSIQKKDNTKSSTKEAQSTASKKYICCCIPQDIYIPVMVVVADILSGIASGMSIKFFPIFFLEYLSLSPIMVQLTYTFAPLLTSVASVWSQKLSKKIGRGFTIILCKSLGISLLVTMCLVDVRGGQQAWLLILLFVVRTALMNGPKALTRSIIMDQVPKEHRAKWSSLESFNTASWSGSAFLGGILVDRFGILNNFYTTSCLQSLALIPILLIVTRIPNERT